MTPEERTELQRLAEALELARKTVKHYASYPSVRDRETPYILASALISLAAEREELRATHETVLRENGVLHALNIETEHENRALKEHILDIDAHATPYGDIPNEPGWTGSYLVTAGSLHRALGKIGHSAPSCAAEAERDTALSDLEAERAENERLKTWIEDHQRRDERFHELQDPRVEALESRYQDLVNAAQEAVIELRWADQRINGEHDICGMCESVDALAALLPPQGTEGAQG